MLRYNYWCVLPVIGRQQTEVIDVDHPVAVKVSLGIKTGIT